MSTKDINGDRANGFKSLPLGEPIQKAIAKLGYAHPTPIQSEAIPHVLENKDVLGIAQTGTGKQLPLVCLFFSVYWEEKKLLKIRPLKNQ